MLVYAEPERPNDWRALCNYYASLFSPFAGVGPMATGKTAGGWARDLLKERPMATTLDLAPVATEDADRFGSALREAGWVTRRYECFGNWYLPCEGLSFEAYMKERPSQTLNTWKRKAKRFGDGAGEHRLQLVTDPAEVPAAMQAYASIYAKSWKVPEPYPDFVPGWASACAERGWLRLGIAWAGDTPIAFQFWFVHQSRAYIFKLAYDEAHSKLSAGTVLSAFMFKHALDVDRVSEIDYLTGDDPYKQAWVSHRRVRVGVIACNPRTLRGVTRGLLELAGGFTQGLRRRANRLREV